VERHTSANLSIPLYAKRPSMTSTANGNEQTITLHAAREEWQSDGRAFWQQMDTLVETLDSLESA